MSMGRRRPGARPDIDREARRYYIYRLTAADGACLYIGRSCQPLTRLRQHHGLTDWASSVVGIDAWGPYVWREACDRERDAVYLYKPQHNRMFVTSHTYRQPKTA